MKKLHYEELTQKEEEKILNCNKKILKRETLGPQSYMFEFYVLYLY